MSVPSKKVTASNTFFTEKVKLEEALIGFEKLIVEGNDYLDSIENSLDHMREIAETHNSAYFLQRVKKLQVYYHTLKLKKGYQKDDFDPIYHLLEKIKNEDRIEFLDSALKNRISKVAKNLSNVKQNENIFPDSLKNKEIFTAFKIGGVYFLIPKRPFRILKNIPAFKSRMSINKEKISLFPGPGFLIQEDDKQLKKNVLLVENGPNSREGYYYDELLEDWAISKDSLKSILKAEKGNQKVVGKIRRKGIFFHILKLG